MKRIEFTEAEIRQLSSESIHHDHPIVRRRMQALLLKSQGLLRKRVAAILNVNVTTVDTYFDLFREGRVAALTHVGYEGSPNLLEQRKDEIIPSLEANPPATLKEAQAKIKEVTGLKRSLPRVSAFLKKTNLRAAK